ncbi:LpqB family beta-propeller domain-containing protein [Arthrobacter sp. MYb227]|uniref:LpqB family beta-propeller domain-containing protein n=1 Tax=Arthrobacter sp. MYb227 TaxID=1848601 RepID=UPI0015E3EE93|nr:LpqB family beta-propeller domain-containing protein [Arthrobacter sp. MYb227]
MFKQLRRTLFLLLGVILVITGCSSIPRNGPVQAIQVDGGTSGTGAYFSPSGPKLDASPREIIEGFIEAGIGPQDDYKIAREFLNPKQVGIWKGAVQTLVYDSRPSVISGSKENTYTIQLEVVAEIDGYGVMTELPAHSTRAIDMNLEKVDGQWRISKLPDGTMIDRDSFNGLFGAQPIYFYDASFQYAVPDIRWFPKRAGLPAAMVEALLKGPAPYLENAVVSAFPSGSSLVRAAVPVEGTQATVDLNSATFIDATELSRQQMQQQLDLTLKDTNSIRTVVMSDEQREVKIGAADPQFKIALKNAAVPETQIAILDRTLSFVKGKSINRVEINDISGYDPRYPAMSPLGNRFAFLDGASKRLFTVDESGRSRVVASGTSLVRPSIDASGWTWTVDNGAKTRILAVPEDTVLNGKVRPIAADWLDGTKVSSIRISRDGTRALIVSARAGVTSVSVSGVLRDSDGTPRGFAPPMYLYPSVPTTSAVWDSDSSVIVSASDATASVTAERINFAGKPEKFQPLLGMIGLSAGPGDRRPVFAETKDQLFTRVGNSWHPMDELAHDLSYPG